MKVTTVAIYLLGAICLSSFQNQYTQTKQVFEFKAKEGYSDFIEFTQNEKELTGLVYGAELNEDGGPVYFRAPFKASITKDVNGKDYIYFAFNKYEYSHKPFSGSAPNTDTINDRREIPFMLNYRMILSGNISAQKLELCRAMDFYDSRCDKMTFERVK